MADLVVNVPRFDRLQQYLGLWMIEHSAFSAIWNRVQSIDLAAHMRQATVNANAVTDRQGSIVRIEVRGAMTKHGSSLSDAGSTTAIRREIRQAKGDPSVGGVFMVWETPGGTVAGTQELHDDIAELAAVKPVVSFIEDLCCSAGMFALAPSTKIYANNSLAWVGSVGTMMALYDMSKAAADAGIVPVVIKTGEFKSVGHPGTEITAEHQAMLQGLVDESQSSFTAAIKSRGLSDDQMSEVLSAKVFSASEGVRLRLIDGIQSEQQALAELQGLITSKGNRKMSDTKQSATLAELKAACPGASGDFVVKQLEAGASISEATGAYCGILTAKLAASEEKLVAANGEIETLKAQVNTLKSTKGKHETATDKPADKPAGADEDEDEEKGGEATAQWNEKVAAAMAKGLSRQAATTKVARANPQLRQAMVAESNAHRKV